MSISCTKCVFAKKDGDKLECRVGRLDKFKKLGKVEYTEDGSLTLKQFCNTFRPEKWLKTDESIEDATDRVLDQSQCSFGIVLETDNKDSLTKLIQSIKNIDYPTKKLVITISSKWKKIHTEDLVLAVERLQQEGYACSSVTHLVEDTFSIDKDSFSGVMYTKCSMILKLKEGSSLDCQFFNWIDEEVNSNLSLTTFFEDEAGCVSVLPFGVVNNCYLDFLDYDAMVEGLRETSRNQGSYKKYEKK